MAKIRKQAQFDLFVELGRSGRHTFTSLAKEVGIQKITARQWIKKLKQKGVHISFIPYGFLTLEDRHVAADVEIDKAAEYHYEILLNERFKGGFSKCQWQFHVPQSAVAAWCCMTARERYLVYTGAGQASVSMELYEIAVRNK